MEPSLIISITSIVITTIFASWNLRLARENHQMKKDEFKRKKEKEIREEFDRRPKFEIVKYDIKDYSDHYTEHIDVDCLVAPIIEYKHSQFVYSEKLLNKEEWVSIIFTLKNVGKSTINHFYISWDSPKRASLFDLKNSGYGLLMGNLFLNYRVILDKCIKTDEIVRIKINFQKSAKILNSIIAEATLWIFDEYGKVWAQPLFVKNRKIYDSKPSTFKEFQDYTNIENALKCFEDPSLW